MTRPLSRLALIIDIALAVALFGVLTPISIVLTGPGGTLSHLAVHAAVIVASLFQCGAVALGRLAPALALVIAWAGAIVQMAGALTPLPMNVAILLVLLVTAAWGSQRVMWAGLISVGAGTIVAAVYFAFGIRTMIWGYGTSLMSIVLFSFIVALALGLAWSAGFGWRMELRARRIREEQQLAEATATQEQERVRIARDMHDVVAHSLAVVIAQADGARYAASADPDAAIGALVTIAQTARGALSDVRMLLTQLRHRQGDGPQPTLADLEDLFAQVRRAGVEPRITVDPTPPGEPPAALQLAVYRILQEALTNALRHGSGEEVDVRLAWRAQHVDLEVFNPIAQDAVPGTGHGVIGMRERAQLVGGTLRAEAEGGRFTVRARLPIGREEET